MNLNGTEYISTAQAACILSFSVQHVRRLLRNGELAGTKVGRDWIVERDTVYSYLAHAENLPLPLDSDKES